mmetsp:Transcript_6516/g.14249  ORF Transcript_6516/g.14249 Transcript_6516/m.14249 type:complete len:95 (-) Transcript_6516:101-385(-)
MAFALGFACALVAGRWGNGAQHNAERGWLHGYRKVLEAYYTLHIQHVREAGFLRDACSWLGQEQVVSALTSLLGATLRVLTAPTMAGDWTMLAT